MVFKKKIPELCARAAAPQVWFGGLGHCTFGRPAAGSDTPHSGITGNQRASATESPDKGARQVKV